MLCVTASLATASVIVERALQEADPQAAHRAAEAAEAGENALLTSYDNDAFADALAKGLRRAFVLYWDKRGCVGRLSGMQIAQGACASGVPLAHADV